MPKVTPVAVDTNVLLDLAKESDEVLDCLATLRERLPNLQIVVLPTVIIELTDILELGGPKEQRLANIALQKLNDPWKFTPVNFIPVGHGIVEQIGRKIRDKGLIPEDQVHDSFIVAEASLYGVTLLLSSDSHIKDMNAAMLKITLDSCDVGCPLIASPWKIVRQFFH